MVAVGYQRDPSLGVQQGGPGGADLAVVQRPHSVEHMGERGCARAEGLPCDGRRGGGVPQRHRDLRSHEPLDGPDGVLRLGGERYQGNGVGVGYEFFCEDVGVVDQISERVRPGAVRRQRGPLNVQAQRSRARVSGRPVPDRIVGGAPRLWRRGDDRRQERGHAVGQEPLSYGPHRRWVRGDVVAEGAVDLQIDEPRHSHMGHEVQVLVGEAPAVAMRRHLSDAPRGNRDAGSIEPAPGVGHHGDDPHAASTSVSGWLVGHGG